MATMNVSLPDSMKEYVDLRVDAQQYGSSSEYIRDLIRRDQQRELMRADLVDGARSPIVIEADGAYFAQLRSRITAG